MNRKTEDNGLNPMKLRYLLVLLLFLPALVSAETVDYSDLIDKNGVFYKKFTNVPFTGRTSGRFQWTYKDGKEHGPFEAYHENGQLQEKQTYKDGKRHGPYEKYVYHENGQLSGKVTFKDDKRHGPTEWYYKNGQLEWKGTYKDGKLVSAACFTETGEKKPC
tara:strand:- start:214 stop:699 length:486 start_codon:yes stop_codon:yes gene_type:complete